MGKSGEMKNSRTYHMIEKHTFDYRKMEEERVKTGEKAKTATKQPTGGAQPKQNYIVGECDKNGLKF